MKQTGHRSSLVLMELIINLFLFAVCAAVCVGLLLHARSMSVESHNLTDAVYLAQSAAEEWQAEGTAAGTWERDGYTVTLAETRGAPGIWECDITISLRDREIYSLEGVRRHE